MDCDYAMNTCQESECCGTARLAGQSSAEPLKRCAPRGSTLWIDAKTSYQYNFVCDTVLTNTTVAYFEPDTPTHDYVVFKELDIKEEESKTDKVGAGYQIIVIAACLIVLAAVGVAAKAGMNYFKLLDVNKGKKEMPETEGDSDVSKAQLRLRKKGTQEFTSQYDPNRDTALEFQPGTEAKLNTELEEEKYDIRTKRKQWKKGDTGGQSDRVHDGDNDTIDSNDLNLQPNMNTQQLELPRIGPQRSVSKYNK